MIKYIALALAMASSSVFAASTLATMNNIPDLNQDNKKGLHGQIGLGATNFPSYFGGRHSENSLVPLINISYNDRFYLKFNRLGAWIYQPHNDFRVGGVITTHSGIKRSDVANERKPLLIKDRDDSIMAGINAQYKNGLFVMEAGLLQDISNTSDGTKLFIKAAYTVIVAPNYSLSLTAAIEGLDQDLVDYYYTPAGNTFYQADATYNMILGVSSSYKINAKWTAIGALSVTTIGDEITDSFITEDDTYQGLFLGASYSF
ncbi:MAG: MipA/OmpV family protein [Thalassotalea sp.]